ncbi:MAG: metal ABC transporter ATP-binding protein [Marinosulfonomonas sp.]|nr:metal ABC transporter ATP-binding protein [Marinosulfonomonas sp.]
MNLIQTRDMSIHYGDEVVLEHVNFRISSGEIVTLVGPNGSGKSTLIRALLGVVPLSNGTVIKQDGLRIGYVPQKLMIDKTMPLSIARFLALLGRKATGQTDAVMERMGIAGLQNKQMAGLSGGQFQRVLLARALLERPEILILDEPTQGLDQPGVAAFYRIIEEVRQDLGCAILLVSHDLHVVMSASDRVICLNGHVCCEGTPQVVSAAPEYRALFGVGTGGTLALYRHEHDHDHNHSHADEEAE